MCTELVVEGRYYKGFLYGLLYEHCPGSRACAGRAQDFPIFTEARH